MQMMQLDYRQHSINIAKGTTTIQGLSSFCFLGSFNSTNNSHFNFGLVSYLRLV